MFPKSLLLPLLAPLVASGGEIVIRVENVKNPVGKIAALLFPAADGFPGDSAKAAFRTRVEARTGTNEIRLGGVPDGRYAVCVIHDANGNSKLDRNFFGIPTEGVGISNGIRREKPTFDKAAIEIRDGQVITVTMKYW